jgi:hypothetical protein
MRSICDFVVLCSLVTSPLAGQSPISREPSSRPMSTLVGMGNSFGGLGVLTDIRAFGSTPFSLVLGAGSTRAFFGAVGEPNPWTVESVSSVAVAVGLRASVGPGRHQGFLELAVLPVDDDVVRISDARQRLQLLYGLGLQLGYRARLNGGLTLNAMAGAGYALSSDVIASPWKPVFGAGFGYAWP